MLALSIYQTIIWGYRSSVKRTWVKQRKQPIESLSCIQVTLSMSGITPEFILAALTDVSTERRSTPQWLLTKQLFDWPLFWQHSLLSKNRGFSFLSLFFFGEVALFLLCPSPCLAPLRFILIPAVASAQIIAPWHVHCLRWESCCLLYLRNSEKHAGPAGQQHEIYIMWKIQGEFNHYTSLFKHLFEKKNHHGSRKVI